ncbi:hypothetical protein BV22DRAFT_198025 [Leucogyrophana mollusca]|uniref:Uncharacterized protein n=1 Tax=Leucogyrophana mollusca TaxID=85980 RepID=A0ACB8BS21_9AGAM|nr:hypothetical protein BV22DRAFT_198025 [Leucogyrophana mollusca]
MRTIRRKPQLFALATSWSLSRCDCFTARQIGFSMTSAVPHSNFIRKFGPVLTFSLTISEGVCTGSHPHHLVLDLCPKFEHLAVWSPVITTRLSHRLVNWVDIWANSDAYFPAPRAVQHFMKPHADFPMLLGVRVLDWALVSTTGPDLHALVPPT